MQTHQLQWFLFWTFQHSTTFAHYRGGQAKSPFKTPAWKPQPFPLRVAIQNVRTCFFADDEDDLGHQGQHQGPKAHPPPWGGPSFIWNPLNLKTFEYLSVNEANNLICILSSKCCKWPFFNKFSPRKIRCSQWCIHKSGLVLTHHKSVFSMDSPSVIMLTVKEASHFCSHFCRLKSLPFLQTR